MENSTKNKTGFKWFAAKRIVVGILIAAVFLWVIVIVLGFFEKPSRTKVAGKHETPSTKSLPEDKNKRVVHPEERTRKSTVKDEKGVQLTQKETGVTVPHKPPAIQKAELAKTEHSETIPSEEQASAPAKTEHSATIHSGEQASAPAKTEHSAAIHSGEQASAPIKAGHSAPLPSLEHAAEKPAATSHELAGVPVSKPRPKGVAFVEATIKPLNYELYERFWGWRPNDVLDFTDNVNNFQLGVLEVTRRTAVILTERISRTGVTASFDKNLENAMNWFMIKSDRYWFPSPESKYKAGLEELKTYKDKLENGEANFHTRTDNLIPLLMAYEDLLGSCEENLVKTEESGDTPVSFFKADDYFFYAKGVASAMGTILEAIMEDFIITVESRRGKEVLHHVIESCHHAVAIDPWIVTNSDPSGILANHRANLAAPVSHARFYIGVLIKTLST
jgi:hypothetical protein